MIAAEGALIGAWMLVWHTIFLLIKVAGRHSAPATSLGVMGV